MQPQSQPLAGRFICDADTPRLRAVLDSIPGRVAYIDRTGIYRFTNQKYDLWFGQRRGSIIGQHVRDVVGDDAWRKIDSRITRALAGEQVHFEEQFTYPDGTSRWVNVNYTPDFDDRGDVLGITVVTQDITSQRRVHDALRWHAQMLKVAQDAIFIWRIPGGIEFWNNGAAELYGYTADEVLGRNVSDLLKTRLPQPWEEIERALITTARWEGQLRHRTKDGHELVVHSRWQRVPAHDGTMVLLESARDITEQMRTETALREAEERFRAFMENMSAMAWMKDGQGRYVYVNPAYEQHLGEPAASWLGKTDFDVWPAALAEKFQADDRAVLARGEAVEVTEETTDRNGLSTTWLVSKFPVRGANGDVCVGGIAIDATARKRAESALRHEHALNATLLRTTAAVIVVLDAAGNIIHFNRAFETATGCAIEETAGQPFIETFVAPEYQECARAVFAAMRTGTGATKHVNQIRTREDRRLYIEWSSSVLFDDHGQIEWVICTGVDITERRAMERQILEIGDRERQRIGQDLHDGLGQELTAIDLISHTLLQRLRAAAPPLVQDFEAMTLQLRETIHHARMLSHGLLPVPSTADGLILALRTLARATTATGHVECAFTTDEAVQVTEPELATHLYRIAQEAVANALKHSRAQRIDVHLCLSGSAIELTISDNGDGFAPGVSWDQGMGLRIMNYRAELIGARLHTASTRGHGVRVTCTLARNP